MKNIIITPLLLLISVFISNAQDPVYTVPGSYGQTFFSYSLNDNFLFAAPQRFRVTSTVQNSNVDKLFDQNYNEGAITVSAGQSTHITIDLLAKGGNPISLAEGSLYLNFFEENHPDSIYAKFTTTTGDQDWYFPDEWSNASTTSPYLLWKLPVHSNVQNVTKIELTIFAHASTQMILTEIDYYLKDPTQFEGGLVSKFKNNNLWHKLSFRDTGNVERAYIDSIGRAFFNGHVGIGTSNTSDTNKLCVNGSIRAKKLYVTQLGWPDYVFSRSYKLPALSRVEQFIKCNNHLPEVPSAAEVEKTGLDVGDGQAAILRKVEELTLYLIQQNKQLQSQAKIIQQQQADLISLKKQLGKRLN